MLTSYNNDKISLFAPLIKNREVFLSGMPWLLDPAKIRFKLGETLKDLKVPYHMGKEDEAIIGNAITSLVSLLQTRYQKDSPEAGKKKQSTFSSTPTTKSEPLMDTTYWLGVFKQDSLEMSLAKDILRTTPLIDSAILKQWLDKNGKGGKLLQWTMTILEKALCEEAGDESGEMTSYMVLLAIITTIVKKKERIKDFTIKGASLERIDVATGSTLFMTIKAAVEELFKKIKTSESIYCNPATESILKSTVIPESFLLIPSVLLSNSLNPYGIRNETAEIISAYTPETSQWPDDVEKLINKSFKQLTGNKKDKQKLWTYCLITKFREHIINYLMQYDLPGTKGHELFYDLYREDRHMHILDPKTLDSLSSLLDEFTDKYGKDQERIEKFTLLKHLIEILRSEKTMAKEAKSKQGAQIISDMVRGFIAYKLDSHASQFIGASRGALVNRREKYTGDLLLEEFKNGRLYRFSSDRREILCGLTIKQEGQLIIDMKDFTKKTLKLKEIAMADFMKENFYEPILNEAKKYGIDKGLVDKDAGITLNGLPGDAAIFSGGVGNLISLAEDISKVIKDYREKVKEKFLPKLDKHIQTIHERYLSQQKREAEEKEDLRELIGLDDSLVSLDDAEDMVEQITRDELEATITEEMDAGLFISYGVKAETMLLETKDGTNEPPVKVAIGEKINESSRGTDRNLAVMNKSAALLEEEKHQRSNDSLINPFEVHIDKIFNIRIPAEIENMLGKEFRGEAKHDTSELIEKLMDEYSNDLEKIRQDMPPDSLKALHIRTQLYNKGHALSKEALNAYIREATGRKFFFKKELPVTDLSPAIQENFYFPRNINEFWFSVEVKKGVEKVELFSRVGEMVFKGFESSPPTEIYEIIDRDGEFFKAILNDHFNGWFKEAQKAANVKYETPAEK